MLKHGLVEEADSGEKTKTQLEVATRLEEIAERPIR